MYEETIEYELRVLASGPVSITQWTVTRKDGLEVGRKSFDVSLDPGVPVPAWVPADVKAIVSAAHTPARIAEYRAHQISIGA